MFGIERSKIDKIIEIKQMSLWKIDKQNEKNRLNKVIERNRMNEMREIV